MGGSGSGRMFRWNTRSTTISQNRIDIRWLKKQNYLHPGCSGSLSWSSRGKKTGSIHFEIEKNRMVLKYNSRRSPESDWEEVKQNIFFDNTPCNFGGFRKWFHCPKCYKRVAILYGAGKYFFCRHCYNLTYDSCNSSSIQRIFDKASKLRERLGGDIGNNEFIADKPKGMHRKTYNQIRDEIERFEDMGNKCMKEKWGFSF